MLKKWNVAAAAGFVKFGVAAANDQWRRGGGEKTVFAFYRSGTYHTASF